ncbi:MAG: DUF2890 domain-containing protein [Polyangiales bacterium]
MANTTEPPRGDPLLGRVIDGYRLESRIGAGATGIVYRARHPNRDKPVAVKVLHENLGRISSLKRRFEREARALTRLTHPSIVHIADFGVVDDITYIAMELLEGETLEDRMQRGPVEPERVIEIVRAVLQGLAFAHELQIVHRDLKPANIFLPKNLDADSAVKILDFGLAKFLSIDELSAESTLTRKGRIVGTPAYMAPEQITGVSLDVRADVYAVGTVLFELLADRRPFDYDRRSELLRAHLFEKVPSLTSVRSGLEVHPKLEAVVRKALAKDPGERFKNAGEMLRAIEQLPPMPIRLHLPGPRRSKERRRQDTTSVVISEREMREIRSSVSESQSGEIALDDGATRSDPSVRFPTKGRNDDGTIPDVVRSDAAQPLGGLPFDQLGRVRQPSIPPEAGFAAQVKRGLPWLLAVVAALVAGTLSYWIGRSL